MIQRSVQTNSVTDRLTNKPEERHPRADTVLVAPLTGSIEREFDTYIRLSSGETGLHPFSVRAEDITVVRKQTLLEPKAPLRALSNTRICQIADAVRIAMGCPHN